MLIMQEALSLTQYILLVLLRFRIFKPRAPKAASEAVYLSHSAVIVIIIVIVIHQWEEDSSAFSSHLNFHHKLKIAHTHTHTDLVLTSAASTLISALVQKMQTADFVLLP